MRGRNRPDIAASLIVVRRPYSATATACKGRRSRVATVLLQTLSSGAKGVPSVALIGQPHPATDPGMTDRGIRGRQTGRRRPHDAVLRVPELRVVDLERRGGVTARVPMVLRAPACRGGRPGRRPLAPAPAEAGAPHAARLGQAGAVGGAPRTRHSAPRAGGGALPGVRAAL